VLVSVFLIRNSMVVDVSYSSSSSSSAMDDSSVLVGGGEAMARKMGLLSSSSIDGFI